VNTPHAPFTLAGPRGGRGQSRPNAARGGRSVTRWVLDVGSGN